MTIIDKGSKLFDLVAVLPADRLSSDESSRLNCWIDSGRCGSLDYMRRPTDRTDPSVVFPNAKTVVVVAKFYRKEQLMEGVARFAQDGDYHSKIKAGLHQLLLEISNEHPGIRGRAVVDSAPIFEKAWARRAGFGWVGRNSLIVNPERGSFFNIGLLLLDHTFTDPLPAEITDHCTQCRLCIDSCPMHAIGEDRMIDAGRCISALTVEKSRRGETVQPIHGWQYGCDECQTCCPFNH